MKSSLPWYLIATLLTVFSGLCPRAQAQTKPENDAYFKQALANGQLANESFRRCQRYVTGWLGKADSTTGLIPRNLTQSTCIWNAWDAAADNYPFMVMTSSLLDPALFEGRMKDMLTTETRLTSRIGRLPDTYSFCKKGFENEQVDTSQVVFGAAEYMKDGLIPLTEWLGPSPWSERMLGMLADLDQLIDVPTEIRGKFFGNSAVVEVNGDLLQVLARMYWMTRDPKWLAWGVQIGDHFLNDANLPTRSLDRLRLRDHGGEIVAGLVEMYAVVAEADPTRKKQWQPYIHEILDVILAKGRNEHGMFYDEFNPKTGEIVASRLADTYGYILNSFYTVYLMDHTEAYREAVLKPLGTLNQHFRGHNWEGGSADGYADAIEGALNLYLREPVAGLDQWIDSETQVLWAMQKPDGIIEGWHGDGNFARTSLMYALWKTAGIVVTNWQPDLVYGAAVKEGALYLTLRSASGWTGKVRFGSELHAVNLNMPHDYPRINQFQEWFPISPEKHYRLKRAGKSTLVNGKSLLDGVPLMTKPNETIYLELHR
ncbi:hypothetical protein [Persicitalea sp.]|uniref:hypothetical protein n=1 Tax=Persicitalea sp. TaxID=3100273 RepID=UPI0035945CE5